ncbi:MAG: hypothetical protein Q7T76_02765 [Ferruginibacter sp.]|nr:hypothetical protein [Ferruginibacter sp.]
MTDIAIVKAYPPPFFGAPGGNGGIAIYTRRGGEGNYLPANRRVFKVSGYTPAAIASWPTKIFVKESLSGRTHRYQQVPKP